MEQPIIKNVLNIDMQIPQTKIARFWEGLKQGRLFTTKCKKCGKVYFPPTADCSKCYLSNMDWIELTGDAELITWTIMQVRPKSFSQHPPYVIAVVKLKEGINVMAWLTNIKHEDIKPGIKLKLVTKELGYEFVPK
jgi:hypothetical protein